MKKLLLLFTALLVLNSAISQVRFGIKAGINSANLSDVEMTISNRTIIMYEQDKPLIGFHAGAFVNVSFGNIIGFQPELLLSMQGGNQKINPSVPKLDPQIPDDLKYCYQFTYLQVPLLLELKPIPILKLGILVGPQFGVNLSKKATETYSVFKKTVSGSAFDKEYGNGFKNLNTSMVFGLQYTILKLNVGARYNLGLNNCLDADMREGFVTANMRGWKQNVLQVNLGLLF